MEINLLHKPGNRYGFTAGHIGIIAVCAIFLLFFVWMENNFALPHFSRIANSTTSPLTYDEVRNKALAQIGGTDAAGAREEIVGQLAQVDGSVGGAVLGASTDVIDIFPRADELFNSETLQKIPLKTQGVATTESVQRYLTQVRLVESLYNSIDMIAAMNATDSETLHSVSENAKNLTADLGQLKVPQGLETYARTKILYYVTLSRIAESFAAGANDPELSNEGVILFSLSQQLEQLAGEMGKYGINQ